MQQPKVLPPLLMEVAFHNHRKTSQKICGIRSVFPMHQKLNVARVDPLVQENNKKKAIRKLALIALLDTLLREEKKI